MSRPSPPGRTQSPATVLPSSFSTELPADLALAWQDLESTASIVGAMRRAEDLARAAALDHDPLRTGRFLDEVIRDADSLGTIAALHAIGRVASDRADEVLVRTLHLGDPTTVGHTAWVLGGRVPHLGSIPALIDLVVSGGFDAMLAQRTLVQWSAWAPRPITDLILRRLGEVDDHLDVDRGDRLVDVLRAGGVARRPAIVPTATGPDDDQAVTVIQPFLHARLDGRGSQLGIGDAGGIASLLRSLGTELAQQHWIGEVVTVTRANPAHGPGGREPGQDALGPGHRVVRIPYGPDAEVSLTDAWIHRIAIERELMHLARRLPGPVVWHVRMADVGTLASTAVARALGHRVVFTVAPDPHAVIAARQADGRLSRAEFGPADASEHLWFRARMVERLAIFADQLVALPRPGLARDLRDLVGLESAHDLEHAIDPDDANATVGTAPGGTHRIRVIAEGVDVAALRRAEARTNDLASVDRVTSPVAEILAELPAGRRYLPWLLTVGRMHVLKGPHRLAEAWASSPDVNERFNLVIVGGDLEHPSPAEAEALRLVRRATTTAEGTVEGIVLAGHRPPDEVAELLVEAARHDGVYVAASDKEEFGLAAVEALGAGLVVVAPQRGGAGSYIESGANGVLVDTTSVPALAAAIRSAADLAGDEARRAAARRQVERDLSVTTMAEQLADLYRRLAGDRVLARSGA